MRSLKITAAALSLATLATAQIPCWESNIGPGLSMGDDTVSTALPLGFNFPFAGATYTDIVVCSNGFIWLGPTPPPGHDPTLSYQIILNNFLTEGPRIAPLWTDFSPNGPGSGDVHFNAIPASGGTPAYTVVTWDNVYQYQQTIPLSVQLILVDGGDIFTHYDANMSVVNGGFGSWDHIIGSSDGNGTANAVTFTNLPIVNPLNPMMHETIPRGPFPLAGKNVHWMATGSGGYVVSERTCAVASTVRYGVGCPLGVTAYEFFAGTGSFDLSNSSLLFQANTSGGYTVLTGPGLDTNYSTILPLGDDDIANGQPLGFNFSFAGITTANVDVSANGIIWLGASGNSSPYQHFPVGGGTLVTEPVPTIAPLWMDLDPEYGGNVYFDTGPNFAMITWVNVPHYGVSGSSNTVQAKLMMNGDIIISYGTANNDGVALVGISETANAPDPGSLDWSIAVPFVLHAPGTLTLDLNPAAGSTPVLNSTFTMDITNIPSGSPLGGMILSFTRTNNNAGIFGATGCSQYVSMDATFLLALTGTTAQFSLPIANNPSYVGLVILAQAATFSPGFNPLGIVTSNGLEIGIGL